MQKNTFSYRIGSIINNLKKLKAIVKSEKKTTFGEKQ